MASTTGLSDGERQLRAELGRTRFIAANRAHAAGIEKMQRSGGLEALHHASENKEWARAAEKCIEDMEAAVALMRAGLPNNELDVRGGR